MNEKVREWMRSSDTGQSSMSILVFMEGMGEEWLGRWGYSTPRDPSDLWRCLQLLAIAPEYAARLPEMAEVSPEWAALVANWGDLVAAYRKEYSTGRAPECYARMQTLAAAANYPPLACPNCGQIVGAPDWKAYSNMTSMRWDKAVGKENRRVEIECSSCGEKSHVELEGART